MEDRKRIQIPLTAEQKAQIERATGKTIAALQLKLDELEPRLAPGQGITEPCGRI